MSRQTLSDVRVAALIHDATAAPSMHNAQPWRFRYSRSRRTFEVRADFEHTLPHADPDTRGLHLGCAAALLNLRVALAHEGRDAKIRLLPEPGDRALLASVRPTGPTTGPSDLGRLYPAIHQRHSSRHPFEETRIPKAVRDALAAAARIEGAALAFPASWHLRDVLEVIAEAEARNLADHGSDQDMADPG